MRVGVVTTSWPSVARPWAGHFVADLSEALARAGLDVVALAPCWSAGGGLLERPGVQLLASPVSGPEVPVSRDPARGLQALAALRHAARRVSVDVWLCHWWPTRLAVPRGVPTVVVLHGSDVDLAERLPSMAVRRALHGARVVAVAPHLARRVGIEGEGTVLALGAHRAGPHAAPRPSSWWTRDNAPRVLTVARNHPSKGLDRVRTARRQLPGVAWLVVGANRPLDPASVRALISRADLVVVPSLAGLGHPAEGRPHVISQALVAGTPLLGGPNPAIADALRAAGQHALVDAEARSLVSAVRQALNPDEHARLAHAARAAGRQLSWSAVLPGWLRVLREAAAGDR